ncbi:Transmembrane and coiled-coil domain-containing protein 4 [Armadillidium nasatum]|uniref:Transmembrane and coiled-coil domain-containing protein 4 n=1 Tax=Armadillidium nasatum TaxID=96803 RepID=A0A5N5STH1_9CRUS|nr:Transmembrane and coiled-coil domain-containing protein 4 [Armadillidium nasatum]
MFNFDLSDIVSGHSDYEQKLDIILKTLGIRTRSSSELWAEYSLKKSRSDLPDKASRSWVSRTSLSNG